METTEKRQLIESRIEEFVRDLSEELGGIDESEGDCWFDAIENRAVAVGDAVSAAWIARQGAKHPSVAEESTCPECGQAGRYVGDRQRELITRRGPATIAEPRYYCPCCRKDFFPSNESPRG
jgi:hypothetical protein